MKHIDANVTMVPWFLFNPQYTLISFQP